MTPNTGPHGHARCPRSTDRRSRFSRPPWTEKSAFVLVADEVFWPVCLFVLQDNMERIIRIEKEGDALITTSKASPLMRSFETENDDFRFHHYFDFICGAGIGGLAAVMLGHLRLSLEETIRRIQYVLSFPQPVLYKGWLSNVRTANSRRVHIKLHDKIEPARTRSTVDACDSPREVCQGSASKFHSLSGMCQTLVLTAYKDDPSKLHVLKSYRLPESGRENPRDVRVLAVKIPVVNVCRASMANPGEYEHVNISMDAEGSCESLVETTATDVNMKELINHEIRSINPDAGSLNCLLELGSQGSTSSSGTYWPFGQPQQKHSGSGPNEESGNSSSTLEHFEFRNLTDMVTSAKLQAQSATGAYHLSEKMQSQLESCARTLVRSRVSRADTMNWEIFAFAQRYSCSICRETGHESGILDTPAFFDHVDFTHDFYSLPPPDMFKVQKASRLEL